jgi:hypothetical protein
MEKLLQSSDVQFLVLIGFGLLFIITIAWLVSTWLLSQGRRRRSEPRPTRFVPRRGHALQKMEPKAHLIACPGCHASFGERFEAKICTILSGDILRKTVICKCLTQSTWDVMGLPICLDWRKPTVREVEESDKRADAIRRLEQIDRLRETIRKTNDFKVKKYGR